MNRLLFSKYDPEKDFTSLEAWRKARELKLFLYRQVIPRLPSDERFNLNIQIRKVGVSGTANIAEGYGRYHDKDAVRFYRISMGSIFETKDHLTSCLDLKYIPESVFNEGIYLAEKAKIALNGYIRYIQQRDRTRK